MGVDEFSLVLFSPAPVNSDEWLTQANAIIERFIKKSNLELLLGRVIEMLEKRPASYTQAFTIENAPYYFAIAFHNTYQHMGILVRFTGQAWATYQKAYFDNYGKKTNISDFLKSIDSLLYDYRLSRIDLTADYINYGNLSPNSIYKTLKEKNCIVVDCKDRKAKRKISSVQNDMKTDTFYIGSRKENSQLFLRVYNKKQEQLETNGFRLDEAMDCNSWTRFEASFKGDYAHQITEQLKSVDSEVALSQFIASKICDKFRFLDVRENTYTDYTQDLLLLVCNSSYSALRTENPKNNSLNESIAHIISGSGLFPVCYKVGKIWGVRAEKELLQMLYELYDRHYRNEFDKKPHIQSWLKKNALSLSKQELKDCFLSADISKADINELLKKPPEIGGIFNLTPIKTDNSEYKEISDKEFERLMNEY